MGNVYSIPPPEPTRLSDTSEQMPDFNNLFQEGVPKMTRVTDDLHQMVNYITDLQNMMIGLDIFIIIGILIYLILKCRNDPPLTTSVSVAAAGTPSVSSLINSNDPSMIKARVFVGNLKKTRVSREDLVGLFEGFGNVLGATLFEEHAFVQFSTQTEAELSVQTLNGYTWKGSELIVKILTLYSKNDAVDRSVTSSINGNASNNNNAGGGMSFNACDNVKLSNQQTNFNQHTKNDAIDHSNVSQNNSARIHNDGTINFQSGNGNGNVKQSISNTNFNQHTTNFIVCCLDSSESLDA